VVVLLANVPEPFQRRPPLVADLDDDGDADVLARDGSLRLFVNQGGSLVAAGTITGSNGDLHAADLDSDGLTDLCFADGAMLRIHRHLGGFSYAPAQTYYTGLVFAFADLEDDGDLDVFGNSVTLNTTVHGTGTGGRRQYGQGSAGTGGRIPLLGCDGPLRPGHVAELRLRRAQGGSLAILGVGSQAAFLPNTGLPGLTLLIQPPLLTVVFFVPPLGTGLDVPLAVGSQFANSGLFLQWFVFDAGASNGIAASNGLQLSIGQ
jgi:hypothetical protein